MRRIFIGFVAGALLALGFSMPAAAAADPLTFEFTDGCGYIDTKVTNNSTDPVQYKLATIFRDFAFDMGPLDFTLAAGATKTHRWLVRFHHGVRASSPALTAQIDHLYEQTAACNTLWPQPGLLQDCDGTGLAQIAPINHPELGKPVFAVNGKPGTPFSPSESHSEFFSGLKAGDVIAFLVPALTEPHELVTWYEPKYVDSPKCGHMPPVTVTPTCDGINVKTVNTEQASELEIYSPGGRKFQLAEGAALDQDVAAQNGDLVIIWWNQSWDRETGTKPTAALTRYAKPASCGANGQLPTTGAPTWTLVSAGGLLLLLGGALFMLTRKRRRA